MRMIFLYGCLQVVIVLMAVTGFCAEQVMLKDKTPLGKRVSKQPRQVKNTSKRFALVIGNSKYPNVPLRTPANDSHALAATLRRLGFVVEEKNNLGGNALKKAVAAFGRRLKGGEVGLFFFAGYGIQVQDKNFLVPVDAKFTTEQNVHENALAADLVLEIMQAAKAEVNIVILDASRDNPIERSFRPASSGLATMDPRPGTIIATAAATGMTTTDSYRGNMGVYTQSLIRALETPGLTIAEVFERVREDVVNKTAGGQIPWELSLLVKDFPLIPPFDPSGTIENKSGDRLKIEGGAESASSPRGFNDALTGMEFITVAGGCFQMGDTFGGGLHWEQPVHVACVNDFSMGKTEVTQGQWKRVMGSNPSGFSSCGDDCPVEMVSWDDAQAFIHKLNRQTGGNYRLPSEAEWEYAARSGGKAEMFSGGNDVDSVAWYEQNAGDMTRPVGTKQANGLGIHDLSGNVWEWVQDWYGNYPSGRQDNPVGPSSGTFRVFRGGCWSHGAANSRVAIRFYNVPGTRADFLGFRLATSTVR